MKRSRTSLRIVAAVALTVTPLGVLLLLRAAGRDRLPVDLPSHFGPNGVDAVLPEATVFAISAWIAALTTGLALAAIAVTALHPLVRRWLVAIFCSIAAVASASWIANASSVWGQSDPYAARVGAGVLLVLGAIVYGVAPALTLPRPTSRETADGRAPTGVVASDR